MIAVLFMFSLSFLIPSTLPFLHFHELSFQRKPSETLDSSTTVDFLVSARISNVLFIVSLFKCFVGNLLGYAKIFNSCFSRFCHWWDIKPLGVDFFYLEGVSFPPSLNGP